MNDHRITWQNPRILCTLLLVFLCGASAGALGVRLGYAPLRARASATYWQDVGKSLSIERFQRELNLSPDQARQMETILNDFVMYYQSAQEQMNSVRADGKAKILQILNDAQKIKFERMIENSQLKQSK